VTPTGLPLLAHTVPGGAAWSLQVARGRMVTFTAEADRANVSLLLFAATHRTDRLNVPDTLKAQYSACIKAPMVLMSDRGIGLASVTGSSLPWHDALCGHGLSGYGDSSYARDRNDWRRSARTGLLSELRKHGRGEADLHGCVNLFSKAAIDGAAGLAFVSDHGRAGDWVALRSEVELLVVLTTAPHPLDPVWRPAGVRIEVTTAPPVGPDDPSRSFRPESARALDEARSVFA
jgi:urea carboxylase-associated protein 2